MRRLWLIAVFVGIIGALLLAPATRMKSAPAQETPHQSPRFTGDALPVPPRQQEAWTPAANTLPPAVVSAARTLFAQGLADPRGCAYRVIGIGTGSCWQGDGGVVTVHGWVLPPAPGSTARFAVGWNGLVYPVVSVGAPADVHADILALIKADDTARAAYTQKHPNFPYTHLEQATSEAQSLSETTLMPLKACLLLRLGEGELAQRYWTAVLAGWPENMNNNGVVRTDPYLQLASDWAWSLFDRAVCAHMRGDDRLALLSARALVPMRAAIEAEAARRHFARPFKEDEHNQRILDAPYLSFLQPLPALLADQERRALEDHTQPFSLSAITAEPETHRRIAGLIRALEEESARQDGQPGGVTMAFDPIVAALVKEGGDAVEPLLTCLESDTRLTRSVSFGRSFFPGRDLLPVRQAAYVALAGILQTDEFAPTYRHPETPQQTAAHIRAFWEQNKGRSMAERWYHTLQDDTATPEQWFSAAGKIVQPTNESDVQGSGWGTMTTTTPLPAGQARVMRGESLRAKTNPSVSELLATRIAQLAAMRQGNSQDLFHLQKVCNMALQFAQWDLPAALPTLRALISPCIGLSGVYGNSASGASGMMSASIAQLTLARMRGKDAQAIPDYLAWVNGGNFGLVDENASTALEPFWRFPHDPALTAGAEELFGNPHSAWGRLSGKANDLFSVRRVIDSPLLGVAAFRSHLLRALADTEVVGTVSLSADAKTYQLQLNNNGGSTSDGVPEGDTQVAKPGIVSPVRLCDYYANELGRVEGMPNFQLYWSPPARTAAITALVAQLQKYGERYAYDSSLRAYTGQYGADPWSPDPYYSGSFTELKGRMSFPRRTQPATAREVDAGTAIFALPADAQARIVPLPALPLPANWTTLKSYPRTSSVWNAKTGKNEEQLSYDQAVTVWQAEESFAAGRWQRYYGILGKHGLSRVPAEEIEFTADSLQWGNLPNGFACRLRLPDQRPFAPGKPLAATLLLRNRRGIDQPAPTITSPPGTRAPSLTYVPHLFFTTDAPSGFGGPPQHWRELPLRAEANVPPVALPSLPAKSALTILHPLEEFPTVTFDLAALFDLTRPGDYHVYLTFAQFPTAIEAGRSNDEYFVVKGPER